jgi:hypothetical protein
VDQASRGKSTTWVAGSVLSTAAVVIALVNNDTYQWAIGVPVVLAVVGVGLRIEAALTSRSG